MKEYGLPLVSFVLRCSNKMSTIALQAENNERLLRDVTKSTVNMVEKIAVDVVIVIAKRFSSHRHFQEIPQNLVVKRTPFLLVTYA
jgi:hypothetical protein